MGQQGSVLDACHHVVVSLLVIGFKAGWTLENLKAMWSAKAPMTPEQKVVAAVKTVKHGVEVASSFGPTLRTSFYGVSSVAAIVAGVKLVMCAGPLPYALLGVSIPALWPAFGLIFVGVVCFGMTGARAGQHLWQS